MRTWNQQPQRKMTIRDLLKKSTPPETFSEVDSRLRVSLYITGVLLGALLAVVTLFPWLGWQLAHFGFVDPVANFSLTFYRLLASPIGIGCLVATLAAWGFVCWKTDGFDSGQKLYHQTGTAVVTICGVSVTLFAVLMLNLLLSALIVVIAVSILLAYIGAL